MVEERKGLDLIKVIDSSDLEILESQNNAPSQVESGGSIDDLPKIYKWNILWVLFSLVVVTICFTIIFSILWGAYTDNWIPMDQTKDLIRLILDFCFRIIDSFL